MYKYPNVDKLLSRRTFLLGLGKGVLFTTIFFRLAYLQLFKSEQFKVLAEKNRISLRLITPVRGSIVDRNDTLLALNKNSYNLLIEGTKNISEINVFDNNDNLLNNSEYSYDNNPNPFYGQLESIYLPLFFI